MKNIYLKKGILLITLVFTVGISAQETLDGDIVAGKKVFKKNCTTCHLAAPRQNVLVGPGLQGVYSRLTADEGLDLEWFNKWIKNSKETIDSGDPYANKVFQEFGQSLMTPNDISDADIKNVLSYLEDPAVADAKEKEMKAAEQNAKNAASEDPEAMTTSAIVWVGFLTIIGLLLAIAFQLNKLVKLRRDPALAPAEEDKIKSVTQIYEKNQALAQSLIAVLLVLSLYVVWAWLFGVGVDKGYKPEQPIYFSHKIHVGNNNIDCQVCHSGAKYGKVSEIPSTNVCMNCHSTIVSYEGEYIEPGKDRRFYNDELAKLFDHAGYDPESRKYVRPGKEIKWTRIHNMPDFVYFNHSQHVVVGEKTIMSKHNQENPDAQIDVVCKACHGAVDTMNVVQMANDFTMEFCIECHRTTEVDMENGYNAAYYKEIHDKLAATKKYGSTNTTVDAIGGIECGKCHY